MTGYTVYELLTPNFFATLIHPEDRDMVVERGRARVRGEAVPETYQTRIISRSGEVRTLAITARRLVLPSGPVSLVSAVDVTPLRQAENALRTGTSTVVELLHSLPAHIITTDVSGKPTFVNRHWLELTGQTESEAMTSGTARLIHPDDRARATERWLNALRAGEGYDIDYRVLSSTGEYRWQNFRIRPLVGPEGESVGWTSASVDVHEAKELAERLAAANEELTKANQAKDEVLGLISHELRTPLTTLVGNTRLLRRRGDALSPEDRLAIAHDLESDALRLEAVIANMLVLSRTNLREPIESEPLRVQSLAAKVIRDFQARHSDREVEFLAARDLPLGSGNELHYQQILENLLSNADKYSPRTCSIGVELSLAGEMIQTTVIDGGSGLREADMDRIFEAFFRSSSAHAKTYGIGLGLTVCRRLVELHGGTIEARNIKPTGSAFSFTTPTLRQDSSDAE
jgi:PAS domain S-box-containing protein